MNLDQHKTPNSWREAGPFRLHLSFKSLTGSRGSACAIMVDQDGDDQVILLPDFADMIPHLTAGQISGEFKIQKRGAHGYGLKIWGLR